MIKFIIKTSIAATLIIYLVKSGRMDFNLLAQSLQYPNEWIICFSLMLTNVMLTTFRWRWLLHLKSKIRFGFFTILKLTWIGALFSSILPGAVTGDIIKLLYAKDLDPSFEKSYLAATVLLDRIFGLCGLLGILGISTLFNYNELVHKSPELSNLIHFNFFLFAGVLAFLATLLLPQKWQKIILDFTAKFPKFHVLAKKTIGQFWHIGKNKNVIFKALALSTFVQLLQILAFYIVSKPFFDGPLDLAHAFTFIPIGFVTIAIPITPSGLGIGHALFEKLFSMYGISSGASLFNFYFVATTLINLLGLFPYLLSGKRHTASEAKHFEDANAS